MSSGSVNPDLAKERITASFHTDSMTNIIDGCPEKTKRRRYLIHLVESDRTHGSGLELPDYTFLSREEQIFDSLKQHIHLIRKAREWGITDPNDIGIIESFRSPLSLHSVAFVPPIRLMGSEEQKQRWLPRAENYDVIGCYAQTELGHGSFVRGIETRADYDVQTKEFVLNSPTISSTKWWSGSLGLVATHALVMAQLYTKGVCHGVHPFIVPIRDERTHSPLEGVEVGDQGPKFGFVVVDNGFLRMKNVRIPRDNLLQKAGQVSDDGTYIKPPNSKLVYGGMLGIRAGLPRVAAISLAKAITIAIRYGCVRRQSEPAPGQAEPQILDYQTQQHKLFPIVAQTYAYWFASEWLQNFHASVMQEIQRGDFSRLAEDHVSAAGLKALVNWKVYSAVEACRMACGGHGYSLSSGLPSIYSNGVANSTAEGETTVLLLQTAKYLLKVYMNLLGGRQLDPSVRYLAQKDFKRLHVSDDVDPSCLLAALQMKSKRTLEHVGKKVQQAAMKTGNQNEAIQLNTVLLCQLAKAHIEVLIVDAFVKKVAVLSKTHPREASVLRVLCQVYGVTEILDSAAVFLSSQYLTSGAIEQLEDSLFVLYKKIRPEAVPLVDSFDFSDGALQSVLGRYDGQVYPNLLQWAKSSPLNTDRVRQSIKNSLKDLQSSKL